MKKLPLFTLALASMAIVSCDNNGDIGSSIITDQISIVTEDDFSITGKSVPNEKIQSRTTVQLLGSINATEYGSLYSDFVTQFMPAASIET